MSENKIPKYALIVFFISFFFYFLTLAPTVMWGDSAKLAINAYTSYFRIFQGNHLLLGILGHWFGNLPFTNYAYSLNLLSALLGSITISLIYLITFQIIRNHFLSIAGSIALMFSHTFWWESTMFESYTLYVLSIVLLIYLSLLWARSKNDNLLYFFGLFLGLGFCNNETVVLYLPAFLYYFLSKDKYFFSNIRKWIVIFIFILAGLFPWIFVAIKTKLLYASMPIHEYIMGPLTKVSIFERSMPSLKDLAFIFPFYLFYQFPITGFILGILGGWIIIKKEKHVGIFLILIFLINFVIAGMYLSERRHNILIICYSIFSIWISYSLHKLWIKIYYLNVNFAIKKVIFYIVLLSIMGFPIMVYYNFPKIMDKNNFAIITIRTLPFRDNFRYFFLPDKHDYKGPEIFAESVFACVEKNGIIISDFTPFTVLRYFQIVEKYRPDIEIIGINVGGLDLEIIKNNVNKKAIYFVDIDNYQNLYKIDDLKKYYKFIPTGPIYKLIKKT